jgi:hypothetical protein
MPLTAAIAILRKRQKGAVAKLTKRTKNVGRGFHAAPIYLILRGQAWKPDPTFSPFATAPLFLRLIEAFLPVIVKS